MTNTGLSSNRDCYYKICLTFPKVNICKSLLMSIQDYNFTLPKYYIMLIFILSEIAFSSVLVFIKPNCSKCEDIL